MLGRARIAALGAIAAVGLGCGPEPCGPWAEQYEVRWDQRDDGLCGDLPTTVSTFNDLSHVCGRCTGTTYATECEIVIDETAPVDATGGTGRARGTLSQVDGPARLEGVVALTLLFPDGTVDCISTYDVTALAL